MHISDKTAVVARLRSAKEEVVPHCGLHSVAKYEVEGIEGFLYKINFWNQHAPMTIDADIVVVELADDAPYLFIDGNGNVKRDSNGNVMCTRRLVFMCPKTKNGTYYRGYDPLEIAQKYVNQFMLPTAWGDYRDFVEKVETSF